MPGDILGSVTAEEGHTLASGRLLNNARFKLSADKSQWC